MLGNDDELEKDVKESFQNSSLSHILAVSGMHVSYVILAISIILNKAKIPKKIGKIFTIIALIFFIFLTGEMPSVKRAAIMAILAIGAGLIYRKNDTITSISTALLIILIQNPFSIMDIGLILSFVATLGIILFYKIILKIFNEKTIDKEKTNKEIYQKYTEKIKEIISVSLSAQILIFPISILLFNKISLTFLISNILVSFFIGIVIIIGFIAIIFPLKILFIILNFLLNALKNIAIFFAKIPLSKITVTTPNIGKIVAYYIIIAIITYVYILRKKEYKRRIEKKILTNVDKFKSHILLKKKKVLLIIVGIFLVNQIINFTTKDLKIHFIDVGQGDASLIITPKNKTILIDGGGSASKDFDVGKNTVVPYLLDRKIKKIDYLIISHFDDDHVRTVCSPY